MEAINDSYRSTLPVKFTKRSARRATLPAKLVVIPTQEATQASRQLTEEFFEAIEKGDSEKVRILIQSDRLLTKAVMKKPYYSYDPDVELLAYKFLGPYIGQINGIQLALLIGYDSIALDIIDATFHEDLEMPFGGGNTSLHLATFLESEVVAKALIDRNVNPVARNSRGLSPCDLTSDPSILSILRQATNNLLYKKNLTWSRRFNTDRYLYL